MESFITRVSVFKIYLWKEQDDFQELQTDLLTNYQKSMDSNHNQMDQPGPEDYLNILRKNWLNTEDFYLDPLRKERVEQAFEDVCSLLVQESSFNHRLPDEFRSAARGYSDGSEDYKLQFSSIENQGLFLSDLKDLIQLLFRSR